MFCRLYWNQPSCLSVCPSVYQNIGNFYAPTSKDRGHIVLPLSVCQSVRPSVCLHKLNMKTEHFPITPKLI